MIWILKQIWSTPVDFEPAAMEATVGEMNSHFFKRKDVKFIKDYI